MSKTSIVSVDSHAAVQELHTQLREAEAELVAATGELNALERIITPLPSSSECGATATELDTIRARQQLPFAQERFFMAKASVLELRPRYDAARHEAVQTFTAARNKARLPILQRLASSLEATRVIGDELTAFDRETQELGGSAPGHPFPSLCDEPPYRQGEATRVRQLVEQLER